MKRKFIRCIACLSMMALIFNSLHVQAIEDTADSTDYEDSDDSDYSDEEDEISEEDYYADDDTEGEDDSDEEDEEITNSATLNYCSENADLSKGVINKIRFNNDNNDTIIPINFEQSGTLIINLGENTTNYLTIDASLYSDEDLKDIVGNVTMSSGSSRTSKVINIVKPGTYYLNMYLDNGKGEMQFDLLLNFIEDAARSITTKKEYVGYQIEGQDSRLYQIHMSSKGLVTFSSTPKEAGEQYANFVVLNSDKNKISEIQYSGISNDKADRILSASYYLEKGDYYLKLDTDCGLYTLGYKVTNIKDQAGTSMKNATNARADGTILIGYLSLADNTSKADWYKVIVASPKSVGITISCVKTGQFVVELIDKNGKLLTSKKSFIKSGQSSIKVTSKKLPMGTYYVKIYKQNASSSGSYTLSVK